MMPNTSSPNLFAHAPSELSQDAFFCWLLEWAHQDHKEKDPALHKVAQDFIDILCKKAGKPLDAISTVKVETQHTKANIDIFCTINKDERYLVIEDKVWAEEHNNQLKRQRTQVLGTEKDELGLSEEKCCFIYLQTGEQCKAYLKKVEDKGYTPVLRDDILGVLNQYEIAKGQHCNIFLSFREYLSNIDEGIRSREKSYLSEPVEKWERDAWTGFYKYLYENLRAENSATAWWGYVNPPSGKGFMCFAWGNYKNGSLTQWESMYLQIEQEKLCVKIKMNEDIKLDEDQLTEVYAKTRNKCFEQLKSMKKIDFPLEKPQRFGNGKTMTVIQYADVFPPKKNGLVDKDRALEIVKRMEETLDQFIQQNPKD